MLPLFADPSPTAVSVPVPPDTPVLKTAGEIKTRIEELIVNSTSAATKRAYAADWRHFDDWCQAYGVSTLPAEVETVMAYLSQLSTMAQSARHGKGKRKHAHSGYRVATITRRLATIARKHQDAGLDNPVAHPHVKTVLAGIRREIGTAPKRKAALLTENFRLLRREAASLGELRDRALLLIGFAGAFRRSELCAIEVADLEFDAATRTLTILLRRSKTDQEGAGRKVVIHAGGALCPITALRAWLDGAGIVEGPVFRSVRKGGCLGGRLSSEGVAIVVKRLAEAIGVDPATFGGHSLRAGHVTQAILRGEAAHSIMAVTGHQSRAMVDRYFREMDPKRHNSSANLGL